MGSGFARRKKEARALQEQFSKLQGELKSTEATGSAGNGLVTITLNGDNEMIRVKIKPECVDPEDVEGLEDLIVAAYQDAQKQINDNSPLNAIPGLKGFGV